MNITMAIIFGTAGLAAGWFIPAAAEKTIVYKYKKRGKTLTEDTRYTSLALKLPCLAAAGALWAAVGAFSSGPIQAVLLAVILYDALVIALIDVRTRMIPNEAVLILALSGLALRVIVYGFPSVLPAVLSMLAVMVVFTALSTSLGKGSVGAGDVKLVGAIGLVLSWPYILYALVGMSALMLLWCAGGLLLKKMTLKSMLAFAPFISGGAVIAIIASIAGF